MAPRSWGCWKTPPPVLSDGSGGEGNQAVTVWLWVNILRILNLIECNCMGVFPHTPGGQWKLRHWPFSPRPSTSVVRRERNSVQLMQWGRKLLDRSSSSTFIEWVWCRVKRAAFKVLMQKRFVCSFNSQRSIPAVSQHCSMYQHVNFLAEGSCLESGGPKTCGHHDWGGLWGRVSFSVIRF